MVELRLRQPVLVARDKDATVRLMETVLDLRPVHGSGDLSGYGLPAWGPMSDSGRALLDQLGVENLIFAVGSDFIEVMFPTRPDGATVGFMDRRGGDCGYMVVLQSADVGHYAGLAQAAGVRISHEADYPAYRDIQLNPRDTGGALLSVARHMPESEVGGAWYPAGTAWQGLPGSRAVSAVVGAELRGPEADALAARWARLLERPAEQVGEGWRIGLDGGGELRFRLAGEGEKEGFSGIDLRVVDRQRVAEGAKAAGIGFDGERLRLCGMDIRLVD